MFDSALFDVAPFDALADAGGPAVDPLAPRSWSFPLALEVGEYTAQYRFPLALEVYETAQYRFPLALAVVDRDAMVSARRHGWGRRVWLDGIEVTERLQLQASDYEARGSGAAVFRFKLLAAVGAVLPSMYVGKAVAMRYVWISEDGTQRCELVQFTGRVDSVALDPRSWALDFTCTDRRKDLLAANPDLLTGSRWSAGLFRTDATDLQRAEDRLSTLCADFHLAPDGTPILSSWDVKPTPDWTFGQDDYVDGSLRPDFAGAEATVAGVDVAFTYRFWRLRQRETRMEYDCGGSTFLRDYPIAPPSIDIIRRAIDDSGLTLLEEPTFETLVKQWYIWDGQPHEFPGFENMVLFCRAHLGRRWAQSVDVEFTLKLRAGSSVDEARVKKIQGSLEAAFDKEAWTKDATMEPLLPRPGLAVETTRDAVDDDDTGAAALENALLTALAMGVKEIRASHRQSTLEFETWFNPFLRRGDTVRVEGNGGVVQAYLDGVHHTQDPMAGRDVLNSRTVCTLAVSMPSQTVSASSPLVAPVIPAPATLDAATLDAHMLRLGNHVGGLATSPAYDEAWQGYICNIPSDITVIGITTTYGYRKQRQDGALDGDAYQPAAQLFSRQATAEGASFETVDVVNPSYVAANVYPWKFALASPEPEDSAWENATLPVERLYLVAVPADEFTFTRG